MGPWFVVVFDADYHAGALAVPIRDLARTRAEAETIAVIDAIQPIGFASTSRLSARCVHKHDYAWPGSVLREPGHVYQMA